MELLVLLDIPVRKLWREVQGRAQGLPLDWDYNIVSTMNLKLKSNYKPKWQAPRVSSTWYYHLVTS